jgi:SAM-dependent methyltransferase
MSRPRTVAIVVGAATSVVAASAVLRHVRRASRGRVVPGGIVIGDAAVYDAASRLLLGPFLRRIAADIAAIAPEGARVLEIGCGPGHLSIMLARRHGLDVTGLDLDPAMVERARANADRSASDRSRGPAFVLGDVALLSFPDESFDLVVSTLSMHHWADPSAGLAEIARVLRPGGRSLVWDLRPGAVPFHPDVPDPRESTREAPLRLISATPWRWPLGLTPTRRLELIRVDRVSDRNSKTLRDEPDSLAKVGVAGSNPVVRSRTRLADQRKGLHEPAAEVAHRLEHQVGVRGRRPPVDEGRSESD